MTSSQELTPWPHPEHTSPGHNLQPPMINIKLFITPTTRHLLSRIPTKFFTHFSLISLLPHDPSISRALISPTKQCFMTTVSRRIPTYKSSSLFHCSLYSNMPPPPFRILFRKTVYVLSLERQSKFHTHTKERLDFFFKFRYVILIKKMVPTIFTELR